MKSKRQFLISFLYFCLISSPCNSQDIIEIFFTQKNCYFLFHFFGLFIRSSHTFQIYQQINIIKFHTYSIVDYTFLLNYISNFKYSIFLFLIHFSNKIMSNSQHKNILAPKKQYNTQNPVTPNKKTPIPPPTPTCHSLHNNQKSISMQGSSVSYAQLQIILQNVQQVKKKTSEQIAMLQKKNAKLEQDYRACKDQLRRYQNLQQTINEEKNSVQLRFQVQVSNLKQQIDRKQKSNKILEEQIQELKQKIRDQTYEIDKYRICIERHKQDYICSQERYRKIADVLKITESSHELKVIQQQYTDIPHLLQYVYTSKINLDHQIQALQEQKNNNEQLRKQISNNNKVINTITQENRHLLKVIQQLNHDKESLSINLSSLQQQKSHYQKENDRTIHQMQEQILSLRKQSEDQIISREETIQSLAQKLKGVQNKVHEVQERQKIAKQENQFKNIVDQVCNEYEDYQNVIKRISYLEKYRSEHYFNIQKIQYLCKILDS